MGSPGMMMKWMSQNRFYLPPHLTILDDYLLKVAKGEINRLIITMPPNGQFSVESTEIRLFKPSRTHKTYKSKGNAYGA